MPREFRAFPVTQRVPWRSRVWDATTMAGLDLPARRQNRRKTRIAPPLIWSGAAHLAILVLLTLGVYHRTTIEPLPPPGIAMVFESGSSKGPSLPNPTREANPEPRPAAAPRALAPSPPPQAATAPALPVPPVPPTPPEEAAQAAAPATAAAPSPATAAAPPPAQANAATPAPPALLSPSPLAEAIPPPPAPQTVAPSAQKPTQQAMVMPPPNARPLTPSPQAAPHVPAPKAETARPGNAYAPMRLFAKNLPSLNKFALGPAALGPTSITPFAKISAKELGADWRNELADWIEQHKYYPEDAAKRGEQGINEVRVVVNRDGHVEAVELERQSGSQRLDSAAIGLFRDADLPPFPLGTQEERVTIDLTIHYVIYRN